MASTYKKLREIYSKEDKVKLIILTFLLFCSMLLEFLGIGLIVPFLNYSFKEDLTEDLNYLNNFNLFNLKSKGELIQIFVLAIASVFVIKFLFLSYLNFRQNKYIYNLNARVTALLFKKYIFQGYSEFTKMKSSDLIKNLSIETNQLFIYSFYYYNYC